MARKLTDDENKKVASAIGEKARKTNKGAVGASLGKVDDKGKVAGQVLKFEESEDQTKLPPELRNK